ncbi:MAG: DUF4278 domain-containing protein [Cyanobacteria bacterium REEB459]|nr:DUF4278 domain-containing protein [Cyanobacteria bacterium REEB459]
MKLSYRGVQYNYEPTLLEVQESSSFGFYRGRSLPFPCASHVRAAYPAANLIYRGQRYATTAEGTPVSSALTMAPQPAVAVPTQSLGLAGRQARLQQLRQSSEVHHTNIERTLNHRIAVARAAGNQSLIKVLEDELHQLV